MQCASRRLLKMLYLLLQLELCGEKVVAYADVHYAASTTVASPMKNIYLPQLSLLVQLKLRIGHGLALSASR